MYPDQKKRDYEEWCARSTQSILNEHPLWISTDRENFHKRFFMSEKLYEAIHTAIYRYDPMAIGHVTPDEYDMEIFAIAVLVEQLLFRTQQCVLDERLYEELFEGIKRIFGDFFGEVYLEDAFTMQACELAAKDIFRAAKEEMRV